MPAWNNYRAWRRAGFLPFEARAYSRTTRPVEGKRRIKVEPVPFNVPYVRNMIRQRYQLMKDSFARGMTYKQYKNMILNLYKKTDRINPKTGKPDAWKTLREWEERGKDDFPDYESPGGKKPRKSRKDFKKKMRK